VGLAGYYRRFVPGFAKIAGPLHQFIGGCNSSKKSKKKENFIKTFFRLFREIGLKVVR
jgi:hypothetical protein